MVNAHWELPVYQVIGPVIRVHWDYNFELKEEEPSWTCEEAVVPVTATREEFMSIVNNAGGDGEGLASGYFD